MLANKHVVYLTKNHYLNGNEHESTNVFMFNENGPKVPARWVKKTIEANDGSFIVMDHKKAIRAEVERNLQKRNYYIENVNLSSMQNGLSINPFDLVNDTSEIHFLFLNFLYAMWDNADPDITAMSNLIDAFASCVFFMFDGEKKDRRNMSTLKKMVGAVRATCQTEDGPVPMADAIFAGMKDQESMPCKYYAQFKRAAADRYDEVAEKVAKVFDMFNENDMEMMSVTDENLIDVFNFKTAVFINIENDEEEHSAKILITLLNYFIQRVANHRNVMFVLDNLDARYNLISLPHWMKESVEHNMSFIVINDDLSEFKENARTDKYFRNLQKTVAASVLVHHNDTAIRFADNLPTSGDEMNDFMEQDCVATLLIPSLSLSEQDELF